MSSRYWVGGGSSTNWNATSPTNWSATDGGSNDASVPADGDDVYLKSAADCVINVTTALLRSFDMTSYSGTLSGTSTLNVSPASGTTVCILGGTVTWTGTMQLAPAVGAVVNLTTSAKILGSVITSVGTVNMQDDISLVTPKAVSVRSGIFNTNNHNVTAGYFDAYYPNGTARTINLGTSTITITRQSDVGWRITTAATLDASSAFIVYPVTGNNALFLGGGKTYNSVTFAGNGDNIQDSNTFITLNVNTAGLSTGLIVNQNMVLTVTNLTTNGYASNLAKILSDSSGNPFHLSYNGSTHISVDYMSIKDCYADQVDKWFFGTHSVNVSGNTNLVFDAPGYYVTGNLVIADTLNSSYNKDKVYWNSIPVELDLSSTLNRVIGYLGNETLSLTPNSAKSVWNLYSGNQLIQFFVTSSQQQSKGYDGALLVDLINSSSTNQLKVYGNTIPINVILGSQYSTPHKYYGLCDISMDLSSPIQVNLSYFGDNLIRLEPNSNSKITKVAVTNLTLEETLQSVSIVNKVYGANLTIELTPESLQQVINHYSGNLSIEEVLNSFAQRVIETTGDIDITFVLHSETGISHFRIPKVCLYGYVRRNPIELNGAIPPELVKQ